jgi:Protein of unknown function (DUF3060)
MRSFLIFQAVLAAGLVLTAGGEGVAQTVVSPGTHRCADSQNIAIEASRETFKITGPCGKIVVKGADNKLTVESAKSVDIDGPGNLLDIDVVDDVKATSAGNTIAYKRGLTRPTSNVVTLGDNNKIVRLAK